MRSITMALGGSLKSNRHKYAIKRTLTSYHNRAKATKLGVED